MPSLEVYILPDGTIQYLHDDKLAAALKSGTRRTKRASRVESSNSLSAEAMEWMLEHRYEYFQFSTILFKPEYANKWWAEMFESDADLVLGPFDTRTEALDAEVAWLRDNRLAVIT